MTTNVWPFWLKPPAGPPLLLIPFPASGGLSFGPAMALVSELLREAPAAATSAWATLDDVLEWAGLPGAIGDYTTPRGALLRLVGDAASVGHRVPA